MTTEEMLELINTAFDRQYTGDETIVRGGESELEILGKRRVSYRWFRHEGILGSIWMNIYEHIVPGQSETEDIALGVMTCTVPSMAVVELDSDRERPALVRCVLHTPGGFIEYPVRVINARTEQCGIRENQGLGAIVKTTKDICNQCKCAQKRHLSNDTLL